MKVVLIGPAHPLRGGIANFNEALFNQYSKLGDDCSIISYSLQYPGFLFPGKTQYASGSGPLGLKSRALISSINPFSWIKTGRIIKKEAPDVVIIHFWMPFFAPALGTISWIAKKNMKTRVIALCHNVKPHEPRPGDNLLTKYFLRKCNGYVTLSKNTLEEIPLYSNNKNAIFIPHPIYDIFGQQIEKQFARQKLGIKPEDKIVLFFGMVRKYKGLDLLLEAMALDQIKQLGIKLMVAGEFYDKPVYYQEIIDRLGIVDQVIIRDEFIPNDDVKLYFCACDIVAQTYHTATQSGVSQIAYHFNTPMLVTNVGGLAEIVPNGKVGYVTEREPEDIANAIADFFNNNRSEEFINNIKTEKKRFEWSSMTDGINQLLA